MSLIYKHFNLSKHSISYFKKLPKLLFPLSKFLEPFDTYSYSKDGGEGFPNIKFGPPIGFGLDFGTLVKKVSHPWLRGWYTEGKQTTT